MLSEIKAQEEIKNYKIEEQNKATQKIEELKKELAEETTDYKKKQLQIEIEEQQKAIEKITEEQNEATQKMEELKNDLASKTTEKNINKLAEEYDKLGKSASVKIGRFIGDKLDAISNTPLKIKAAISSTVGAKIGKGLISAGEAVKDKLSKIKIGIKQASGSEPGKMLKTLGGIGKTLGVVGIVMSIISKSLTKLGDPFESLIDSLVDIFVPIMKALMPPLMSILTVLVKSLLPPLLRILSLLMKVLSVTIVPVLGFLLKALSHIPGLGFLREVADGISEALGPKTQKAIEDAAYAASNLSVETKENTEETKKSTENKKEQIQVGKSGRVTVTKAQYKEKETKEEIKKETNSSQAVANNTNTNTNVVALKETNKELLDIKLLMGQFMSKISEIIDRNNNSMEMAKAVEIGCKRAYQDGVPVKIEELPSAIGGRRDSFGGYAKNG